MNDLIAVNAKPAVMRAALAVVAVVVLVACWFAVRWQIGSLLTNLTSPSDQNAAEIAQASIRLAPSNPAGMSLKAASESDPAAAIPFFEQSVRLAPNDYRLRVDLGRAIEQEGDIAAAQPQFQRAVDLAPNFAAPRWHLGNFYLRQGRETDAISQLKRAAANNQTFRDQVFSLGWDYFQKDPVKLEALIENPASRAHLAYFFAARGVAEPSLRNWVQLSQADKERYGYRAVSIADGLYIRRQFPEALGFAKELGRALDAEPEKVTNGGFEAAIGEFDESKFGWQIARTDAKVELLPDSRVQHSGSRSLRLAFRGFAKPILINALQTVVVEPNQNYSLTFWVKTEALRSAGTPLVEILNGVDDKSLVRSQPFAGGSSDWQMVQLDFRTPENCTGIFIRTIRNFCGDECPIAGTVWYDDFVLARR